MMHQLQGTLAAVPPFYFDKTLEFLGHFRRAMGEQQTENGVLTKAISINSQVVVFRVQSIGTLDAPELAYILYSAEPLDKSTYAAVRERLTFFLSLEDDLRPFY